MDEVQIPTCVNDCLSTEAEDVSFSQLVKQGCDPVYMASDAW